MCALAPDFYPVQLHEARYQGVYEGGPWVLIAGLRNPRRECPAFASDIPCFQFWQRVQEDGPVITLADEQEIYAAAGEDPASLLDAFVAFIESADAYRTGRSPSHDRAESGEQ